MNKSLAMRLFVYIRAFGHEPVLPIISDDWRIYAERLQQHYQALCQEFGDSERKRARTIGRAAIRTLGLREASDPFPLYLPDGRNIPKDLNQTTRAQRRLLGLHTSDAHICSVCHSANGRRKISWHTRELAEEICAKAQSKGEWLKVYKCPCQNGMWHLGRSKSRRKQREAVADVSRIEAQ